MLENTIISHILLTVINYKNSLDFDCDFCNKNAYDNFHFSKSNHLEFVICRDCLNKVMGVKNG